MNLVSVFDPCRAIRCSKSSKCVATGHQYKGNRTWEAHCACDSHHKGELCQSKLRRALHGVLWTFRN